MDQGQNFPVEFRYIPDFTNIMLLRLWFGIFWFGVAKFDLVWPSLVWFSLFWFGLVGFGGLLKCAEFDLTFEKN